MMNVHGDEMNVDELTDDEVKVDEAMNWQDE